MHSYSFIIEVNGSKEEYIANGENATKAGKVVEAMVKEDHGDAAYRVITIKEM